MGLDKLEWHPHAGGWVARLVTAKGNTRRFAHVNIYDWSVTRHRPKGAVPVQFQFYKSGYDISWHDSIEAAKLHVEAIFALDYDTTDSLTHWR